MNLCVCVSVCVCVWERERECVCVCVRARARRALTDKEEVRATQASQDRHVDRRCQQQQHFCALAWWLL